MDVIFYSCATPPNYIYKVLENGVTVQCKMHDDCELRDPEILVSNAIDVLKYNYAHIPEIARFYFIESFERVAKGVIKVKLHIDVLRTYAKNILKNCAVDLTSAGLINQTGMTSYGKRLIQQVYSSDYNCPYDMRLSLHNKIPFNNPKDSFDVTPTNILIGVSSLKA